MTLGFRTKAYTRGGNVFFRDNTYSPARGGLWEMAPMLAAHADPGAFYEFFDDFFAFDPTATVGNWATVLDAGPTLVAGMLDTAGGWAQITTDGDDEDEYYLSSIAENWIFAASKPLWFEARVSVTEGAAGDGEVIIGLSDTVAANSLLDAGAGPMASYDGAVWFRVEDSAVWQFETSNAGTQVTNASAGAFLASTIYRVGFIFDPADGTTGAITPYLNGVAGTPHAITLAGLEEMHILAGVKNVGTTEQTLNLDYIRVLGVR
jgi:hypothetical protein